MSRYIVQPWLSRSHKYRMNNSVLSFSWWKYEYINFHLVTKLNSLSSGDVVLICPISLWKTFILNKRSTKDIHLSRFELNVARMCDDATVKAHSLICSNDLSKRQVWEKKYLYQEAHSHTHTHTHTQTTTNKYWFLGHLYSVTLPFENIKKFGALPCHINPPNLKWIW